MTRLVRTTAPTAVVLIIGAILMVLLGLTAETITIAHAAAHTLWLIADTIHDVIGWMSLGCAVGLLVALACSGNEVWR